MNQDKSPQFNNLRAKEACKYLGVGKSTLWLYVKQGKLKSIKLSDRVTIFQKKELDRFITESANIAT